MPPHRVTLHLDGVKNHYFVRSGNSFQIASHTMLEDMFGRRPKPELSLAVKTKHSGAPGVDRQRFTIILGIVNSGRGVAKSPFLSISLNPPHEIWRGGIDGNGNFGMAELVHSGNPNEKRYGATQTPVIHSGITHEVTAIRLELFLSTARTLQDIVIDYKIAAEGIQLIEGKEIIIISTLLAEFGLQAA